VTNGRDGDGEEAIASLSQSASLTRKQNRQRQVIFNCPEALQKKNVSIKSEDSYMHWSST
jgi:hypothetical protein